MACWHGWRRPAPPAERDRKSTRLNSSHGYISYAVSLYRKSTRLNSSHGYISYAVFCLKKKKSTLYTHVCLNRVAIVVTLHYVICCCTSACRPHAAQLDE